ncbi:MAG: tyrosine-type recombinase/integrase [Methylobacter sp.]|uniref:tyrosine-type recombinase/integrase n=1 Tax=Methylobacter sp. TaxID=2051955 RepID=UPI0027313174|nr:tyrosine-type recombinase/integrase [Methylobacter sp.]MDP1666956.1 tyrosine-type recombinase/integrase [Methylobacter sp.]
MFTETHLADLTHLDSLVDNPLSSIAAPYVEALNAQHYARYTIERYVNCVIHFGCWLNAEGVELQSINQALFHHYLHDLLLLSSNSVNSSDPIKMDRAALKHLLTFLPQQYSIITKSPIEAELERFTDYLLNICGMSPQTCVNRCQHVGAFLSHRFCSEAPVFAQISGADIDAFFQHMALRWRPASLKVAGASLRSYLRFCALQGEPTTVLSAFIPRIASWSPATLPKVLSDTQVDAFLKAFDCTYGVGMRDYAIARCLLDIGLRGHEVTYLKLDSVDWRNATLTISSNKSKRVQQLPLPVSTGQAIAQYLFKGRPLASSRILFVRHRAPFDQPLSVPAIRNAMNRAFTRCGLRNQFCNTHVLRSTTATRLQKAGASIKDIADLLRHQCLDTAKTYARVDLERLRAVALPWPGSCS